MKTNAAFRIRASMDPRIFYRGLTEAWSESHAKNQHLIFVTSDKEYALEYAKDKDHVYEFYVDFGVPFNFGFRSLQTKVMLAEVVARIKQGVMNNFSKGKVSRAKGLELMDELRTLEASGHKEVWEWYMQTPKLCQILSASGYDSIEGSEGLHNDVLTYGLFNSRQLKKL